MWRRRRRTTATCCLAATRTCRCCSSRPSVAGACPWYAFVQQDAGQGAKKVEFGESSLLGMNYSTRVLSKKQYDDEVSWTTRTWSSLMAQRMSVALHMAAAWEVARELSLAGAEDEAALFGGGVADSVA